MNSGHYLAFTILLLTAYYIYFSVARTFNIVDHPNHRTMHEGATIRGGGIVVLITIVLYSLSVESPGYYFIAGLTVLGITGFMDDIIDLPGKVRIPIQTFSVVMILIELDLTDNSIIWLLIIVLVTTGIINAFNFMDGINGMTGGYNFVITVSLIYVNNYLYPFISNDFLTIFLLALISFNFFNFRIKAVCFAGDVGSLTIAFIIVFMITKLISQSQQFIFILFLTLYGIDTIFTIILRILRKENIFVAHRLHFFQVVVSKTGISHLSMSTIYMIIQAIVNIFIICIIKLNMIDQLIYSGIMLLALSILYIFIKVKMIRIA